MVVTYAAILKPQEDGHFEALVPDLKKETQGKTLEETVEHLYDLIASTCLDIIDLGETLPKADLNTNEDLEEGDQRILIRADLDAYRKEHKEKCLRVTVSAPEGLVKRAKKAGINFSKAFQQILREKLNEN